jgi:hypothetical protein
VPFFSDPSVYLAGEYVSTLGSNSLSVAQNLLLLRPIHIPFAGSYSKIAFEITGADSTALIRVGLYDCDALMHPTSPIFDSGDITPSSTGLYLVSAPLSLSAKPYYLAWISKGASFTARCWSTGAFLDTLGVKTSSTGFTGPIGIVTYNKTYGSLPDLTSDNAYTLASYSAYGYVVAMALR